VHTPERLGPFQVVRALGQGAMGAVFEVIDPQLGRRVALKLLKADSENDVTVERFYREADMLARLQHPGVVKVHRVGELPVGPYILEERVEGQPLETLLERGPLGTEHAARLIRSMADALAVVHSAGIVHRDLKPANVMIRANGAPVLIDFGVARDSDAETLTKTGALVGTVAYMSPEQVHRPPGSPPVDGRSDVYALGVILYELLVGQRLYDGPPYEIMARILRDAPPSVRAKRPEVSEELDAVLQAALTREPSARIDAAALREELDRFLAGEPTESAAHAQAERSSRRFKTLAGVAVALALCAGLTLAAIRASRSSSAPPPSPSAERPMDEAAARAATALAEGDPGRAASILEANITPLGSDRSELELRIEVALAEDLAQRGELAAAVEHLQRAEKRDPSAAQDALARAALAVLGEWSQGPDPARVAQLETLATAWPKAKLPPEAAGPYAALALARLGEDTEAGVVAAAELTAKARRWEAQTQIPAGLAFAASLKGKQALSQGRLDVAARLLVAGSELGTVNPSRVSEGDLRRLTEAGTFERLLADERSSAFARLWAAMGEALLIRKAAPGPSRSQRGRRAKAQLRLARSELPPAAAAVAAGVELRLGAALDPSQAEALAEELWEASGAEGWRVARVAAVVLRRLPERALPWAQRALQGAALTQPGSEVHVDGLETLVRLLLAAGRGAAANDALQAEGARRLLGPKLFAELQERSAKLRRKE
jgi:hypothetical protein